MDGKSKSTFPFSPVFCSQWQPQIRSVNKENDTGQKTKNRRAKTMSSETKKDKPSLQPFRTCTGLELANAAPETYHGLVDDLLLDVGVSMLCGKPKTGKSTLLRQLAFCVAESIPFLGKPTQW